ncbi:MAG: VWA domain-containing protein, partial [Candidatus Dormibacteraceae bacterium]
FILVGTMNPEEGELRPQLLDRFGLCVDVGGIDQLEQRVEVIRRELNYRSSKKNFRADYLPQEEALRQQLVKSVANLGKVQMKPEQHRLIASISLQAGVQGHRADLVIAAAARSLAALHNRSVPTQDDLWTAAELALTHRANSPFQFDREGVIGSAPNSSLNAAETTTAEQRSEAEAESSESGNPTAERGQAEGSEESTATANGVTTPNTGGNLVQEVEEGLTIQPLEPALQRKQRHQPGRRATEKIQDQRGRYVRAEARERVTDLAVDATIRAAAPYQLGRGRSSGQRLRLEGYDLQQKIRQRKVGHLVVFAVDASASMDAEQRMTATKGAVLSLIQDVYVRRDRVAVVVFKNRSAEVVLQPTASVRLAMRKLERLSVGGTTPLTHGLVTAHQLIKTELRRDSSLRPLLVLISDGRGNISMFREEPVVEAGRVAEMIRSQQIESLVIDSARDFGHLAREPNQARLAPRYQSYASSACAELAEQMGAQYCGLHDLSREEITRAVSGRLKR